MFLPTQIRWYHNEGRQRTIGIPKKCDRYEEEKQCSLSSCWEPLKTWILLVFTIILLGLFYVATDKQNFIKYVSRREDLRKFILLVAWLYFVFCCLIGTLIFSCLRRLAGLLGI